MRKMTEGNKARFLAFSIIIIATVIVLLIFLTKALSFEKEMYDVEKEICIYDANYEYIEMESDGIIEKKWTGLYYLNEPEIGKSYELGKTAIGYDLIKNRLSLYGTFYEVALDGEVTKITKKNTISDMLNPKLYKIEDRKYLLTGPNISNESGTINTENYLIIVIDKSGNTLLLNNKLDVKTINAIILETDTFKFDIANEKLIYDDYKIDLKKIIGSTNQYVEPVKTNEEENNTNNENNVGGTIANAWATTPIQVGSPTIINTGTTSASSQTTNQSTGKTQNSTNNSTNNSQTNISVRESTNQNKTKIAKNVNLRSITPGGTYLDVSYSVIDPENEYQVVYLSITGNGLTNTISLDKAKDYYRITDLQQNTDYSIVLGYKEIQSDSTVEDVVEDIINIKTLKLEGSLEITKITSNKIYFNLKLDSSSSYDNAKIYVYVNGNRQSGYIEVDTIQALTENGWSSSLDKTDSMIGKLTLTLIDVKELDLSASIQIY